MENLKPVEAAFEGGEVRVAVTGREYRLSGALPASIVAAGEEILSAPISLAAAFSGEEKPWDAPHIIPVSQNEDQCVYTVQQGAGNMFINARVTLERDGLIWVDLLVDSYGSQVVYAWGQDLTAPTLTSLKLVIPLKAAVAELYHYWPIGASGVSQMAAVRNSGAVPEPGLALPMKPCLWLGREERGLAFYMESSQNTQPADPQRFCQVKKEGDSVVLTVDLLDSMPKAWQGKRDSWNEPLEPVCFSFGLQATPVKPYVRQKAFERVFHSEWSSISRMDEAQLAAYCQRLRAKGVKWQTFHEDWSVLQNYGLAWDEDAFRHVVKVMHSHGLRVMVYFGYECATAVPDWFEKKDNYLLKSAAGHLRGGWQRAPHQRDYMVCYKGDYSRVMLERVAYVMDSYGVDGIYNDGTFIPAECANEAHGCGWRDEQGALHETFPLRAVREHVKKLHGLVHARGGIVEAHQSSCCVPMVLGFADSYFDGEHIQGLFAQDPGGLFSSGVIRSEFGGVNFGVPIQFLSATDTYSEGCGVLLLHNTPTKVYGGDPEKMWERLDEAAEIWGVMDDFGTDAARFVGYWDERCPVRTDKPRVLSSAWVREDGSVLAVAVNLGDGSEAVQLSCGGKTQTLTVPRLKPVFAVFERGSR